jgi:translocation and assembly module TamB
MKKTITIISEFIFLGILFLLLGLSYWLLYTTSGLNWTLKYINQATDSMLDYGSVTGAWLTKMEFTYLIVKTAPLDIQGDNLHLEISVKKLLSGTLDIVAVDSEKLTLKSKPTPTDTEEPEKEQPGEFALPIGLKIHSLSVDTLSYELQDQQPYILENIHGTDSEIKKLIEIGSLSGQSPYGDLSVTGSITPTMNGKIDLQASFTLKAIQQIPEIKGIANLDGTLNNLSLRSQVTHPSKISINANLASITDAWNWRAEIGAADIPIETYFPEIPITLKNIKLNGAGNFANYTLEGIASLNHKEFGNWDGQWAAEKTDTQWNIGSLNLQNSQTDTTVSVNGTMFTQYTLSASTPFSLYASWQNLQWPIQNPSVVASKNGTLSVEGSLEDYQLNTEGIVVWSDHPISNIAITAQGNTSKLLFKNFSADVLEGHVKGSGMFAFAEDLAWNADTNLNAINLRGLYPQLNTKLNSQIKVEGAFKNANLNSKLSLSGLKGTISEHPIEGKAQLSVDGQSMKIDNLVLRSGKSRLRGALDYNPGDSTVPPHLGAKWDVYLQNLELLMAGLEGSLTSKGTLTGDIDKLSGNVTLKASDIQFENNSASSIDLNADIDLSEKTKSHVSLLMQQAKVNNIPVQSLQLDMAGTGLQHTVDTKIIQDSDSQLSMNARGSWKENQWIMTVNETQLQTKQFGNWLQAKAAMVKINKDDFSIADYCLKNDKQSSLCGSINAQNFQKWDGIVTVKQLPFVMFKEFLPSQFDSTEVDLNGHGEFEYTADTGVILDFKANGKNGVISGIKVDNKETPIAFNRFEFALSNVNKKLEGKTSIEIENTGSIALDLAFPNWSELSLPELNQQIQGHAKIDLSNLTVLSIVSAYIKDPIGQWHSDIAISGTLEAPVLIGESRMKASSLTLTTLGLKLRDVDLKAVSNEKHAVNISGSAKSGEGSIIISGIFNDYRATESTGSIKITGEKFELARIPEATIIVSPDLRLSLNKNSVDLRGDISITDADIKIFAPTKTLAPSSDVVIVSAEQPETTQTPINLTSKIRIILGKKVKIQGYGFTGRLEGSVLVDDTEKLTSASGVIRILEGKYAAYGTQLDITSGSLSFAGSSIDNPLINVRAERSAGDNVTAGVLIEGDVKTPKITLFSEPSMDDSDILSYIILGQPLSAASDKDGKLLTNAAASLGLLGGEKLAKEIGDKFGIDEIKIQTDQTTKDTSLLLGKYLSPDFYVGYAIGIGNAVDTLQIQYKLTEQWVLKTQSGEQQKAEILFTIERD